MTELDIDSDIVRGYVAAARLWWLFLLIGAAWLLFAIVVFRFSYTSVSAISILFGVVVLVAGIDELFIEGGWMKVARLLLALALIVIGILAFVHPGDTFRALAAVMSFYFVLKGMFTTVVAFTSRHLMSLWWLWLLLGLAEILIGFWAAGDFGNRAILLVVWVGVLALTRGIGAIIFAFEVRNLRDDVEAAAV